MSGSGFDFDGEKLKGLKIGGKALTKEEFDVISGKFDALPEDEKRHMMMAGLGVALQSLASTLTILLAPPEADVLAGMTDHEEFDRFMKTRSEEIMNLAQYSAMISSLDPPLLMNLCALIVFSEKLKMEEAEKNGVDLSTIDGNCGGQSGTA